MGSQVLESFGGSLTGLALTSVSVLVMSGLLSTAVQKRENLVNTLFYSIYALASLALLCAGFLAVRGGVTERVVLAAGLPGLPFHLRLDPLSGFFISVVSLLAFCASVYSVGYAQGSAGGSAPVKMAVFYPLFVAGMILTILADDAFSFLTGWEIMAVSSYFLVLHEDRKKENRRAALLYLVMAHAGALAILLSFGVLAGFANGFESFGGYAFDSMRAATVPPFWAGTAFLLAFLGFGAKAGIVPLHVWLPEAHPAAPSNVSALMSGAMLKTAIYGIMRVSFDVLRGPQLWWGELVLVFGLASAIMGVLYAVMENDLKRLLAYSSVENVGVILIGLGLSMIFVHFQKPVVAALALTASLYHALNHAVFKGLLFMGAGSVLHATHERDMDKMGGLVHRMRWTAPLFLVGCLSISALPPFNGFVSEWLTFQAFLMSPSLASPRLNLLVPLGAALLALTAALSASAFVKAFGTSFLGRARSPRCETAVESPVSMVAGMTLLAAACLLLGVFPTHVIGWISSVTTELVGDTIAKSAAGSGWLWLTPISAGRASYSAPMMFLGMVSVVVAVYLTLHARRGAIQRVSPWDCGYGGLTDRMQYGASSFSMPTRVIFGWLFRIREKVKIDPGGARPPEFPLQIRYSLRIRDRLWWWLYEPVVEFVYRLGRLTARLQHGRIHIYLAYSFATVIFLLLLAL